MKLFLDNCVVNKLVEDNSNFSLLKELKGFGQAEYYICYSVLEELASIPDSKKEKRITALDLLLSLEPKILNDRVCVIEYTRFDLCNYG